MRMHVGTHSHTHERVEYRLWVLLAAVLGLLAVASVVELVREGVRALLGYP